MNKFKKLSIIFALIIVFFSLFSVTYAKYSFESISSINVYIDKTPPIISLTNNNTKTDYNTYNYLNFSSEVKVEVSDNIQVKECLYYYNNSSRNYDSITGVSISGKNIFSDEGYYKIVCKDTSNNTTIVEFSIDTSAPVIDVKFYKTDSLPLACVKTYSIACTEKKFLSANVVNTTDEEENSEIETTENKVSNEVNNETENEITNNEISTNEETETNVNNEVVENSVDETQNEIETIDTTEEETIEEEPIMPPIKMVTASYTANVSNETEFRNALNNGASTIVTYGSINFSSTLYINYNVRVTCGTNENALRYTSYNNFIVVQNGGCLTIDAMVIDCRQYAGSNYINCINVQSGGTLIFKQSSIIDGGMCNNGIVVNGGGAAIFYSGQTAYTAKSIVLYDNASLTFYNINDGRTHEFWNGGTCLYCENFYGTVNLNVSNLKFRNDEIGIQFNSGTGTINMSAGYIYSQSTQGVIVNAGTFNFSGGAIYSCSNYGIDNRNGTTNITGGAIYSNNSGVLLKTGYVGKFTMSGGSIYSNTLYSIKNNQNGDGTCNVYGGSISGAIYLGQSDNYVNTNTSYPTFTVTPSTYSFKRKLVRTSSNAYANNEISNVTMTPNGSWYKYVEDEYIKVWLNCNVIVNAKDYYGNVIKTQTINGTLGNSYSITAFTIDRYDLIETPSNISGKFTQADIVVNIKYDLKNVAQVKFSDSISDIVSAKYWFNSSSNLFEGNGTDFATGTIFRDYGYYKVVVVNSQNLTKEYCFELNKNSNIR